MSLNRAGLSLLAVMISTAIMGMIFYWLTNALTYQLRAARHLEWRADLNSLRTEYNTEISAGLDCGVMQYHCTEETTAGTLIPLPAKKKERSH